MIIYSTTLNTVASVINAYGGTTWISLSGYMLRGATSGVVANSNTKTGGNDSVSYTPTGSNDGTAITIDQMPSHNHGGSTSENGKHNHTLQVNQFFHPMEGGTNNSWAVMGEGLSNGTDEKGNHTHTINSQGGGQAHSHTFRGSQATINTLPAYKSVYIWERTA